MKIIKRITLTGILMSLLSTVCGAQQPLDNIADDRVDVVVGDAALSIDMSNLQTTRHEIALMAVLSDICPSMLNKQDHANFYNAYNRLLSDLLPTIDNPRAAMQYLSTQQDYQQILNSVRDWTLGFSIEENKALCEEMTEQLI